MSEPEEMAAAVAAHQACLERWARLSPEVARGTTYHGADAHLPRASVRP